MDSPRKRWPAERRSSEAERPAQARVRVAPLLLLCLAASGRAAAQAANAEQPQLSTDQLGQLVAYNLQAEDVRGNESFFSLFEFQDISGFDCQSRLVALLNWTATLREGVERFHTDILGTSGLYLQLLGQVPEENTWVWLVTGAQERVLQKVVGYWSRISALSLDQHQCIVQGVRDVLLDGAVRWKQLHQDFVEMQWNVFAFGAYRNARGPSENLVAANLWISTLREWLDRYTVEVYNALANIEAMSVDLTGGATRLHHQDEQGSFVTYEFLRRKVFKQWAIDKGLLRGLLRHVWQPPLGSGTPMTLGDFGAGGGHYSTWLNESGLVQAFAFDGTRNAAELTGGVVQQIDLVQEMRLWRTFHWVMCLEVGEHIPKQFSKGLLRNLKHHARLGLVMSWSDDWEGIGHVNCLSREEFLAFVQAETGFVVDAAATKVVKESCEIDYIARTIAVFRAPAGSSG